MIENITMLIVGTLVGFIAAISKDLINYFFKSKKEKNETAIKRLDEAFLYLSKSSDQTRKTFTYILSEGEKNKFDEYSSKLTFIIRVHFPTLQDKYNQYLKIQFEYASHQIKEASKILDLTKEQHFNQEKYDKEIIKYSLSERTKQLMPEFENTFRELCTLIVDESKKYQ